MNKTKRTVLGIFGLSLNLGAQATRCPSLPNESIFPSDNPWHYDVSGFPVHPNSDSLVASVGKGTALHPDFGSNPDYGIPYIAVGAGTPLIAINFTDYGDESDPGPYPIPLTAPVEGGAQSTGDRHVLAVDTAKHILWELYNAFPRTAGWDASCGAKFDLRSNALRPDGWTSADAAGLPIFAGLVRYDETVERGEINHAIRMTVVKSRREYLYPATHQAGSTADSNVPAMGQRFRLKAGTDLSGYPASVQPILKAMKKYGMIVADNGSNWYFSGASDDRWSDDDLNQLKKLHGSDFEAVLSVDASGNPIRPAAIFATRINPLRPTQNGIPWVNLLGRRGHAFTGLSHPWPSPLFAPLSAPR